MSERRLTMNLPGTGKSRNGARYLNQEAENSSNWVLYQEPNQEVQALTSWVDQEVIGFTGIMMSF